MGVIELGFLEEAPAWKLESRFFPSKVGGKPAWLNLAEIPKQLDFTCETCKGMYLFLCQIYAPINELETCFHRTLFIFFCPNISCQKINDSSCFKVYRSQLKRANKYYPYEPPTELETWRTDLCADRFGIHLCIVCGIRSTNYCAKCKTVYYCSRGHQIIDWQQGHKKSCGMGSYQKDVVNSILLPEFEIFTESEEVECLAIARCDDQSDEDKMNDFRRLQLEGQAGLYQGETSVEELFEGVALSRKDKAFAKFRSVIQDFPEQVLRYDRGGLPLWISENHAASEPDIPLCVHCGNRRVFEFQLLPQLLNHLKLDKLEQSVDWGTLAVYTCGNSCDSTEPAYKEEVLWKQDFAHQ